jgi:hypothetical protein
MTTKYPWQGDVRLTIRDTDSASWQLRLRVPDWSTKVRVALNGQALNVPAIEDGYLLFDRVWQPGDVIELTLTLEPHFIEPHPRVDAVRNSVAIQRGPLVYCLEQVDCQGNLMDIQIDSNASLQSSAEETLLPEPFVAVETSGAIADFDDWQDNLYRPLHNNDQFNPGVPVPLKLIPYYAWANRGATSMRVWIPRKR